MARRSQRRAGMTFARVFLCTAVLLACAAHARADETVAVPRDAVVKPAAQPAGGQRLAAPILLSVEIVPDPAPAAIVCDDRDPSRCDRPRAQAASADAPR